MKTTITIILLMAAFIGTNAFAVGFLGSPTAELGQGNWSIGYEYSYSSQDTEKTTGQYWLDPDVTTTPFQLQIKDFDLNRHYATLGYGITEDWDVYLKLGFTDLDAKKIDFGDPSFNWSMNFDADLAWGWGTRYTFSKQDTVSWGVAAQMNWIDTEATATISSERYQWDFESYDFLVSAGPTVDMGGWNVYGGPFYYCFNGDYDLKVWDVTNVMYYTESADIEADSNFGGFIGTVIELGENCDWTVEYNMTGDGWGVGTGIVWTF